MTNLPLPQYYAGVPPPVASMTLGGLAAILAAWGAPRWRWRCSFFLAATSLEAEPLQHIPRAAGVVRS
jgi:hypothetical protein